MMTHAPGIAHAGSGNDDLRRFIEIDRLGFVARDRKAQPRKRDGIDALSDKLHRLFVKAGPLVLFENTGCLHRKRTVHIDRKIRMIGNQSIRLDFADKIQHFLCAPNRKRRNDHISTLIQRLLDDLSQLSDIIRARTAVQAVAIGRLHHDIICRFCIFRIFYQRLVFVADIP